MSDRYKSETNKVVIYGSERRSVYFHFRADLSGETPRIEKAFCDVEKTGSDERAYMSTIAALASALLKYEPVEKVAGRMEGVVTSLRGPVKSPSGVKFCFGYIDLYGREMMARQLELEAQYATQGQRDHAHSL